MAIDRGTTVKKAEDLVREGRPELAIAEYLRLVEDQPGDVGAANALGDLYVKVGHRAQAVARFVQIGDSHRDSGFVPKAVAFYKKALKIDPASDHALSQLAQIAIEQALYADATLYLNRLLQRRREQSNEAGVAECLVRLGGFPTATADAKMAAARAAAGHFPATEASRLWVDAADALERAGRPREALDVLMQADARVHKTQIDFDLAPDLPLMRADRAQIQQMILSLVRNAIEALAEAGTPSRKITIRTHHAPDGRIELSVCDNGPGVAEGMVDRLFIPFVTTKSSGTGLGLAISQTIAQAHGGAIAYRPNKPTGACFSARFRPAEVVP